MALPLPPIPEELFKHREPEPYVPRAISPGSKLSRVLGVIAALLLAGAFILGLML